MTTRRTALGLVSAAALATALPLPGRLLKAQGAGGDLGVSIRVTAPPLTVAPAGFFFEAELDDPAGAAATGVQYPVDYQPAFHEVFYIWSLPDGGPVRSPEHLVAAHRRTDRAMGPYVARVFETPGTHRVAVEAFAADGRRGRAEVTVEVADPEEAFGPDGTIVVAMDGDFTGAPPHHARNAVTDLRTAHERYDALGVDQVRILLKRGQVHPSTVRKGMPFREQTAHCHIGAWGEGARPVIDMREVGGTLIKLYPRWDGHALVLHDLHFRGGWDPTTELWEGPGDSSVVSTAGDAALLLHDCYEEGCGVTVNSRPPRRSREGGAMTFFNEYTKTDFKDFLLLGPREKVDVAITGCRVVQNPQALNGGENRATTSYGIYGRNAHNFIRCSARRLYVASNDIFMRHGWARYMVFDNPAFRLNRNDVADMRVVIARNHIEGMMVRNSKRGAVPMNLLIEQNYIVSNPTSAQAISLKGGAASIRNNIVLEHDTPKLPATGPGFQSFVGLNWDGKKKATREMPFFVCNNSFILLRRDENAPHGVKTVINAEDGFAHVREANNLLWTPNLGGDPTGDGPLDTMSLGWDARYRGVRLGWARLEDQILPDQMFPGDTLLVPYWTDFFGNPLSRSDFAGEAGRHAFLVRMEAGERLESFDGLKEEAGFAFEPEGVRVTNLSPARWPAGAEFKLHCDRGTTPMAMQEEYGQPPGTLALYRPLPGSGAWQSATQEMLASYDFLGNPRPGTVLPSAPTGRPSRGAVEPQSSPS